MDEKDTDILRELMADGKAKIRSISRKIGLPMSTVHHRILKMESSGLIRRFSAIPDYKKLGLPICAYVFINVDYTKIESQDAVASQIRKLPNVADVSIVSGDIDIIAKIRAKDVEDLSGSVIEKLRNIKGVSRTVTSVVMKEID
jgi:Lrp/AsnC family transcriptional regulator, leucine-responsive regulatory protein